MNKHIPNEALDNDSQQSQQNPSQFQQQPQYGQIEGQVIKLGGLDYNLLKQQKDKEEKQKKNFITSLKDKINIISADVMERVGGGSGSVSEGKVEKKRERVDERYTGLLKVLGNNGTKQNVNENKNKKSQTYLLFELDDFGRRVPMYIEKRIGKASNKPILTHFDQKFCTQFQRLIKIQEGKNANQKNMASIMVNQRQEAMDQDQDEQIFSQHSIFGNDSSQQNDAQKKKQKPQINIEIGKKLNFGLDQDDIFGPQKRDKPIGTINTSEQPLQNDKYFFMRKRVKKTVEDNDDGYGQCFHQSGPSLQELVDLKKQGIQYYGDLKQFKPKERKGPNIHKQYQMVQRIIQKNSKK